MINTSNTLLDPKQTPGNVLSFGHRQAQLNPQGPAFGHKPNASLPSSPMFGSASGLPKSHVVKFASTIKVAPHVVLESNILSKLASLNNENDPSGDLRSAIAEALGRAQIVPATKQLLKLTTDDAPIPVRTSAYKALAKIADVSTYNRVEIGKQAMENYGVRMQGIEDFLQSRMKEQMEALESEDKEGGKPKDPEEFLDKIKKNYEDIDVRYKEVEAVCEAIGASDYPQAKQGLRGMFGMMNQQAEGMTTELHMVETALMSSQNRFIDKLNRQDEDDFEEILDRIPPQALNNMMMGSAVTLADGSTVPFSQAMGLYFSLLQALDLNKKIQSALAKGLSKRPDMHDLENLKLALKVSSAPGTTAMAIETLAPFKVLTHDEIKGYMNSSSPMVRRAAVKALLYNQENAGKENLLDLLNANKYFQTVGYPSTYKEANELIGQYYSILSVVVYRGEDFIQNLASRAQNKDADFRSRQMSLLALGYMTQAPFNREIHQPAQNVAKMVLDRLSADPVGQDYIPTARTSFEKNAIRLIATEMSLQAKNPGAVGHALDMLTHPANTISNDDKEELLSVLYSSLLEDHDEVRKDEPGSPDAGPLGVKITLPDAMRKRVLDVAFRPGENGSGGKQELPEKVQEMLDQYESKLKPDARGRMEQAVDLNDETVPMTRHERRDVPDTEYVGVLKDSQNLEVLHKQLGGLLEDQKDEGTLYTRALSAQILGLLGDKAAVDSLVDITREPFKGKQKWHRSSMNGNSSPARDAAILRNAAVQALGHIGDPKALDVMLDLLNDPVLSRTVVEEPLAHLATALNGGGSSPDVVKEALSALPEDEFQQLLGSLFQDPQVKANIEANMKQMLLMKMMQNGGQPPEGGRIGVTRELLEEVIGALLDHPQGTAMMMATDLGKLGATTGNTDTPELKKVNKALKQVIANPANSRLQRYVRLNAANTLAQFNGGIDTLKQAAKETKDPNFKRHILSALITKGYALDPAHPDHDLIKPMLTQGLGIEELHERGITGKGVEVCVMDGGYIQAKNTEEFQDRVKLPPEGTEYTEHTHPTMVASTLGGNGVIRGVAPDATMYSIKWPELDGGSDNVMDTFKSLIEGKMRGENNIRIINNSWGLVSNSLMQYRDMRKMMKEFKKIVEMAELANIQLVFSAGNSGESPIFPGLGSMDFGVDVDKWADDKEAQAARDYILDKVITVGASNPWGSKNIKDAKLADFSSTGDFANPKLRPSVIGPGVDMMVNAYENGQNSRELVNGTSFSGPWTSGVLTLMAQVNPKITNEELRKGLTSTAIKIDNLVEAQQGNGHVSPKAAIHAAELSGRRAAKAEG